MFRHQRRLLSVLVMSAFLLVALGGDASAHRFTDTSRLTIHKNHANPYDRGETVIFRGRVIAAHKFCRRHRVVKLIKNPGKVIEKDITGSRGRYKVVWQSARLGTHFFHTRVKPKVGGVHPHRHACRGDRSRNVKVVVKNLPG